MLLHAIAEKKSELRELGRTLQGMRGEGSRARLQEELRGRRQIWSIEQQRMDTVLAIAISFKGSALDDEGAACRGVSVIRLVSRSGNELLVPGLVEAGADVKLSTRQRQVMASRRFTSLRMTGGGAGAGGRGGGCQQGNDR